MARHGVPTERDRSEGHLSAARAVRWGKAFLVGLSPCSGRLAQARWFPHSGTVMGIRVVWTFVWLQQKQNASQASQNPTKNGLAPTYKPLTRNEGCELFQVKAV